MKRKTINEYVDYSGNTYEISQRNDHIAVDTPNGWYEFGNHEVAMEYLADMADRFGYE